MARPTLFSNRKFMKLAQRLQSEALALGHLEFIWHAANETGNPILGDADDVEMMARWRGARGELVAALTQCGSSGGTGFLDLLEDGRYQVHDYWHHAPNYAGGRREKEEERTREKYCEACNKVYFSADVRSKFCSAACRNRSWRDGQRDGSRDVRDGKRDVRDGKRDGSERNETENVTGPNSGDGLPLQTERSVTDRVTDRDGLPSRVTDPNGTPAPAPAPAQEEVIPTSSVQPNVVEFRNSTAPGDKPRPLELEIQKPPAPDPKAERRAAAGRIFDHWRITHEHERAQSDDKRLTLIGKALDAGYSEADLCQAITGYLNSPHHMGENDRNTKYDSIELMLRGPKYIDQGLKFYADPPRTERSKLMRRNQSATAGWKPPELRNAAK